MMFFGLFADDEEAPFNELKPKQEVFSYLTFLAPTEEKKEGTSMTLDTITSYVLVLVNLAFQGLMLYTIFERVVVSTDNWRRGITDFGGPGLAAQTVPLLGGGSHGKCNPGVSLCSEGPDGGVTCAPPSVQLTSRWDELDLNGDGIWTKEEVMEAREELKCKYVVDPLDVFYVFVKTVVNREKFIWVHPDIREGIAIPKPYFTYASGDIIMCGYRDVKMCGNLLGRGFFDAALEFGTVPRVGNTSDSAMAYCRGLLEPGGFCATTLPSTYSVWRLVSEQECQTPSFEGITYTHPKTQHTQSYVVVDYSARLAYQEMETKFFVVFAFMVLVLWYVSMVFELKDIILVLQWVRTFPDADEFEEGEHVQDAKTKDTNEHTYKIRGINKHHRCHVAFLGILRMFMLFVLTGVGTTLVLKNTDYRPLLLSSLSLLFILNISSLLYTKILRPEVRKQVESLRSMQVPSVYPNYLARHPMIVDMLWLVVVGVMVAVVLYHHYTSTVYPLNDALGCACTSTGRNCREANVFNREFWHDYWKHETPKVFTDVADMRKRGA